MSTTLFVCSPFHGFDHLLKEVVSAHCGPSSGAALQHRTDNGDIVRALKPRMDLHENAQANTVTAIFELPGLTKENVQIDVHNGRLNISAESRISSDHEESGYAVRERRFGKFARSLQLPRGVKEDQINAKMEDGVLTVTFPKSTPDEAPTNITIA